MDNLILGIKTFVLGVTAAFSSVTSQALIVPKATPTPQPTNPPASQVQEDTVIREGEYSYSNYNLKYSIAVPKKGGDIIGAYSGVCEGPITGKFEGGEGGNIKGETEVDCKVAIFSYKLKASYTGKLYLKMGKADLNWKGKIPYTQNSGNLSVNFEPVN